MNKGLEALKELKEACETHMGRMIYILQEDKFELIENELKRLEKLDEEKTSFDRQLEKELKAFEIIKEKPQATLWLTQYCDKETEYDDMISIFKEDITKEQFNLLKEVLL